MTDLNQAYSSLIDSSNYSDFHHEEPPMKINPPMPQMPQQQPVKQQLAPPPPQPVYQIPPQFQQQPQPLPQQRQMQQQNYSNNTSYIDRLISAKKDVWKAVQVALIIVLAMSVHFILDHYLKIYFSSQDLSFERELMTRLLYPLGALFLLWNLKAFSRS